jgi:hypothetical protein
VAGGQSWSFAGWSFAGLLSDGLLPLASVNELSAVGSGGDEGGDGDASAPLVSNGRREVDLVC